MRKFFKIFFSVVVILYFSATMFYCFVAGTPEAGKGAAIYIMSAAGLSILFPAFTCGCIHYIIYLRKEQMIWIYVMIIVRRLLGIQHSCYVL